MRKKGDGQVHRTADVRVDFLICFSQVEGVFLVAKVRAWYRAWTLDTCIVDHHVNIRMVSD